MISKQDCIFHNNVLCVKVWLKLYYYTSHLLRYLLLKKKENNKCQQGCGHNGTLVPAGGNVNLYSCYGKRMVLLKQLKLELSCDPEFYFWAYKQRTESRVLKRYVYTHAHSSTTYNRQDASSPKSNDRLTDKQHWWYTDTIPVLFSLEGRKL